MNGGNPYVMALIAQIGVGFTAICSLAGILIQVRAGGKAKKNDETVKEINKKIDQMKIDSEESDRKLNERMDHQELRCYKDSLIIAMSKIQNGYIPTLEEKYLIHEQKAKYNTLGGNSYVDEMFDKLVKKDLI
jgi:hypothetical protein